MKQILRSAVHELVKNPHIYTVLVRTVVALAHAIEGGHRRWVIESAIKTLFGPSGPVVKHGPFAGMVYPYAVAVGSALFPKLLGSYERELHGLLKAIMHREYSDIVDIGCAEGYYAVGLALSFPEAAIHAFDVAPAAVRLCEAMARANGVDARVRIGEKCDPEILLSIPLRGRALFLSDCEGYETSLFTMEVIERLRQHDFLIEAHDFVDVDISRTLHRRFRSTHDIQVIDSVDDHHKALVYDYPELQGLTFSERKILLAENRPTIMQWHFMRGRGV